MYIFLSVLLADVAFSLSVTNLKTEYLDNPLGIDKAEPRFQWDISSDDAKTRGLEQVSYRILIGEDTADGSVWDSQVIESPQTYQIKYKGPPLKAATLYRWTVSVVTKSLTNGHKSDSVLADAVTSAPAFFSMGMLSTSDWSANGNNNAEFIGPSNDISKTTCPWFRKTFDLPSGDIKPGEALLHLASVGYHELYINGQAANEEAVLLPSVSYLPKRVLYRTYDVSSMLTAGAKNVVAVWACAGWGTYDNLDQGIATHAPLVLVKMTLKSSFSIVSDASWKVAPSNLVSTGGGPGGGDTIDDGKANPLWNTASFDDSNWRLAVSFPVSSFSNLQISADAMEPTRRHSSVSASKVSATEYVDVKFAATLPRSKWWGPSTLRNKPDIPEPFCGSCSPDPASTASYKKLKIECAEPGDEIEKIDFAVWGAAIGGPSCSSWKVGHSCGNLSETTSWVTSLCVGKSSCILDPIRRDGYWDTCPGQKKTMSVVARCKLGNGSATGIDTPSGPTSWLVTMSELYTGWFEVHNMTGPPGSSVHFQISTTAGKPIEFGMQDQYTFGASGKGMFRMRFAYHEIRYITITGLNTAPAPSDIIGYRLTSLGNRTGDFSCSNNLITDMYKTTVNNYRGLTTGGMTVDCPHRERRGYGGDGHTSYQFSLANFPVGAFFNKWTRDFADVQGVPGGFGTPAGTGLVPNTAPTVSGGGGPAWSGFVVTNPWQTYNTFGDMDVLENMYPTMVKLLQFYTNATHSDDGLLHPWDKSQWDFLGDWITPHGSESHIDSPENLLFNNCYLHYITMLVSNISTVLGKTESASKYASDAEKIALAVNRAFGNASSGIYVDTLQTHAVMPLASGLVPSNVAGKTWTNLANQIEVVDKGHLDTGLTGTYFMTKLLMEAGRNDLVFAYANKTDFPSYGYFLKLGYTTWPEQWNVQTGDSLMHGCFNGIGLWFIEGVAGIRVHASESPPLTIRAGVDAGDITSATGNRLALNGQAYSSWKLSEGNFIHNITIPGGGVAKVMIPSFSGRDGVTESGMPVERADGVSVGGTEIVNKIKYLTLQVVSGTYNFASKWSRSAKYPIAKG